MATETIKIFEAMYEGSVTKQIADALEKKPDTIKLLINSPGGSPFEGFAAYEMLKESGVSVEAEILSLAASAATLLLAAVDKGKISIAKTGMIMIHDPSSFADGKAKDIEKVLDRLKQISKNAVDLYAARTGLSKKEITRMMDEETWFDADEAVKKGFADKVIEVKEKAKLFTFADFAYKHIPAQMKAEVPVVKAQDAEENKLEALRTQFSLPDNYRFKIDYNGTVCEFTKDEVMTFQELQETLGVDSAEKVIPAIQALKDKEPEVKTVVKDSPEMQAKLTEMEEKQAKSDKAIEFLTGELKKNSEFQQNQKLNERDIKLESLVKERRILAADIEMAKSLFEKSEDSYRVWLESVQTGEPRYKDLETEKGGDSEDEEEKDFTKMEGEELEKHVVSEAKALVDHDKVKDFNQAYALLKSQKPELIAKYEGR